MPAPAAAVAEPPPVALGKYKVVRRLAAGAFGEVYEGLDPEMRRPVAIKLPTAALLETKQARDQFLHEARSVARLRHANIVTVHDFGQETSGRCYLVYDYIEGTNLAERLKSGLCRRWRPPCSSPRLAKLCTTLICKGCSIGTSSRPISFSTAKAGPSSLTLALRCVKRICSVSAAAGPARPITCRPSRCAARGISSTVRSDIYSLGVVLYEALCGQRPFSAATLDELYELILHREARPLRQINDAVSRDLERICLKAMSRRITDRYSTAHDMAEELRLAATGSVRTPLLSSWMHPSAGRNRPQGSAFLRTGRRRVLPSPASWSS